MPQVARRMYDMEKTAVIIRNLFSAMSDADTISFGGGAPASDGLPVEIVREICDEVLTRGGRGVEALQYGSVPGVKDLRQTVVDVFLKPKGIPASPDEILIVNGGLETMNLICQVYINPGDVILVESPTFVQCVEIFQMFQARCIAVECDESGMITEDLEDKIKKYRPKFAYVIPTFQNPTGKTLPADRRRKIAELGSRYDVIILEDDPYQELRYSGEPEPPIKRFDATGHTVYANSFSKIFSPGSRLGFVHASKEIIARLFDAKTATNSHTSMLTQVICAEFFKRGYFEDHLRKICAIHRERRDVMMDCIDRYFPPGTKKVFPDGGLFTWVELPGGLDATELLHEANARHLHYIAGEGFFVEGDGKGKNCMRLSFGNVSPEAIETGMKRLGELFCSKLKG